MSDERSYASPAAFRRALTDKLNNAAKESRWTLAQLQRQMAYDRLLERLYLEDQGWIVKGATALLARDIGVRATIDIDVYRGIAADIAERELRSAVARRTLVTGSALRSVPHRRSAMPPTAPAFRSRHTSGRPCGRRSTSISSGRT